jgi:hypothetical protein
MDLEALLNKAEVLTKAGYFPHDVVHQTRTMIAGRDGACQAAGEQTQPPA